jgi:O-antigen/teichoic acid export membrane protein
LGVSGLLLGYAAGRAAGAAVLFWKTRRDPAVRERPHADELREVAREYSRFPRLATWSALLNSVSAEGPVIVIALLFGADVAGFMGYTVRVLQTPMALVGQAAGQVYYARASRLARGQELRQETQMVFRRLVALGAGPLLLIVIAGPDLFSFAFGAEWREAGVYARWLAPWLFVVFVASPLSSLTAMLNRQGAELAFQALLMVGRLLALCTAGALGTATLAVQLLGVISLTLWAGYLVWLLRLTGNSVVGSALSAARQIGRAAVISAPMLLVLVSQVRGAALLLVMATTAAILAVDALRAARSIT